MDVISLTSHIQNSLLHSINDDDISDRMNYRYTVMLLIFSAIVVTSRQYGSEVIVCWLPAHFTSNYEKYVSQICWVQNTYFLHQNESLSERTVDKPKNREVRYYQWVSLFLLFQSVLFYLPRIYWKTYSDRGGLYIGDLVSAAYKFRGLSSLDNKKSYMTYLIQNIDRYVDDKRRHQDVRIKTWQQKCLTVLLPCLGRYLGNYIVILYLGVKVIYIINSIIQVYIASVLLGQNFLMLGFDFTTGLFVNGWNTPNSKYFPRVTICDFLIREIGNPKNSHKYTVQCVLPINLFNQQIFTVIWFWFLIVAAWNLFGLFRWTNRCLPTNANAWVTERVDLFNELVNQKKVQKRLVHFVNYYLELDGIFMLRLIANNASDYVATDLIHQLWCQHHEKYGHQFPEEPHKSSHFNPCTFVHQNTHSTASSLAPILRLTKDRKKPKKSVSINLNERSDPDNENDYSRIVTT